MPNAYAAADTLAGLVEGLELIPAHMLKSTTFDQGSEWAWAHVVKMATSGPLGTAEVKCAHTHATVGHGRSRSGRSPESCERS